MTEQTSYTFEDCIKKCESIIDGIYQDGYQSIHLYSLKTFIYGMVDIHNKTTIELQDEVNQFRAIGTVEDYWKLNEMCKEYSAIGTIEEFKALKEKNEPKKPNEIERKRDEYGFIYQIGKCPCCGKLVTDDIECCDCMQKLDWSE